MYFSEVFLCMLIFKSFPFFRKFALPMSDRLLRLCLLQGAVWDWIKPQSHNLNTVTVHRLVGVDGMPISIRGSTVVQFSIYGVKF